MARQRSAELAKEWRKRLRRFARYEGTVLAFCEDEGVSDKTFYYWRKRLRGDLAKKSEAVSFVEVSDGGEGGTIEVSVGEHTVRVRGAVDRDALRCVLDVLATR